MDKTTDKIIDITKIIGKAEEKPQTAPFLQQKATNPIVKKLARFANEKLSQKLDINDLLR